MTRIEANELHGGQPMAQPVGMPHPVGMPEVIQQPELANNHGDVYHDPSTGGTVENFVNGRPWNTGLFDCHENQSNGKCCMIL